MSIKKHYDSVKIRSQQSLKFLKKLLIHTFKDLLILNLILFGLIVLCIVILNESDSGNYIAEILGMIITINIIDFLNDQRIQKQEKSKYDFKAITLFVFSHSINKFITGFLGVENINNLNNNQISIILNSNNFWESEVSIEWKLGCLKNNRRDIWKFIVKYLGNELNKFYVRFSNYIDGDLLPILLNIELATEDDVLEYIYKGSKELHVFNSIIILIESNKQLSKYVDTVMQ